MDTQQQSHKTDDKAKAVLSGAAKVFAEKGYHHASMRDISRETGMSLAGMYHYFSGKEEILYSIQKYCFREVLDSLQQKLAGLSAPREKLETLISNHLAFFTQSVREMKVLSHESDYLSGAYRDEIDDMKREYYRALAGILDELHGNSWSDAQRRRTTLSIFGMINWIYTWYTPSRDGTPEELGGTMIQMITRGIIEDGK